MTSYLGAAGLLRSVAIFLEAAMASLETNRGDLSAITSLLVTEAGDEGGAAKF